MRFLGPNLPIWCNVPPLHQCKMPQKERRKCTLSIKNGNQLQGGGGFATNSLTRGSALYPAKGSDSDPVIAMVSSIVNSSLCSTKFFFLIMPRLTPTIRGHTQMHVVFALPCLPCSFLTLQFPLPVVCRVTFLL